MSFSIEILISFLKYLGANKYGIFLLILVILTAIVAGIFGKKLDMTKDLLKEDVTFTEKIKELDAVTKSLNNLMTYIETQKKEITEYQKTIQDLENRKSELEPVVEANKKIVEALFAEQERRNETYIWFERIISFLMGVIGSIFAGLLIDFVKKRKSGNK